MSNNYGTILQVICHQKHLKIHHLTKYKNLIFKKYKISKIDISDNHKISINKNLKTIN